MKAGMEEPPFLIDGAEVLRYALVDLAGARPNRPLGVAGGVPLDTVRGVIVARNLVDDSVFGMYCNERWETIAATPHADADAAVAVANGAFTEGRLEWRVFRPHTEAEREEIASTRHFLRSLADDPDAI